MSVPPGRPPAVVDTNVFGAEIVRRTSELAKLYRPILLGRPLFISFQTVAELRYGARLRSWGQRRLQRLEFYIARAEVVWPHDELLEKYVDLRVRCERIGHALAQRHHDSDRWIAANGRVARRSSCRPRRDLQERSRAGIRDNPPALKRTARTLRQCHRLDHVQRSLEG